MRVVQAQPLATGSGFLKATRPAGLHYDFEVSSGMAALWQSLDLPLEFSSGAIRIYRLR